MRIKSRLINRIIDKLDAAFTWSSRILPPDKPIGKLCIYGMPITQLDVALVVLTILMAIGFGWWYGHWSMSVATIFVMVMLWIWMW